MKEGQPGSSSREGKREFPKDTVRYLRYGSWDFYISKKEEMLMIDTNEYHPGMLYLTKSDLEEFIKKMDE
ncbi:hypothetical protein KY342_02225 [Candidatus Woesearchaeota archaeon]|nr:hypothetical protein [Candidatus Woesearchaeota archaeon]